MLTFLSRSLRRVLRVRASAAAESLPRTSFSSPGASAFLAGEGARLYSLDAYRRLRRGGAFGPGPGFTPSAA
jgi:hypothetical protein